MIIQTHISNVLMKMKMITAAFLFVLLIVLIYQEYSFSNVNLAYFRAKNFKENRKKWIISRTFDKIGQERETNPQFISIIVNEDVKKIKNTNRVYSYQEIHQEIEEYNHDRKNIAYLFAIKNGAEFIYDCEIYPKFDLSDQFAYNLKDYGLIYDYRVESRRVINPLAHFGQPLLIQKGNPFGQETHINSYFVGRRNTSAIQHLISSDSSDDIYGNNSLLFDQSAPSFQLPVGKMGVFNSKATLYSYRAFWALYLPATAPRGYSDIWRSFWSQRLMWLIDESVTFIGPKSCEPNSYSSQNIVDNTTEAKITDLIGFLYKWNCTKFVFYDCIIDLSLDMAKNKFWKIEEVELLKKWLNKLLQIGYKMPKMKVNSTNGIKLNLYSRVRFTPKIQPLSDKKKENHVYLNDFCNLSNYKLKNSSQFIRNPYKYRANYTLLITFNLRVFPKNIPLLVNLLESYFQNIVFCGARIIDVLNESRNDSNRAKFDSYTFIEYDSANGYYHYYCMNKAIEMNYNTEGILLASDDVLIKPWNLKNLDPTKIWYFESLKPKLELKLRIENFKWMWWRKNAQAVIGLFSYFRNVVSGRVNSTQKEGYFIKEFMTTIDSHRVDKRYISFGGSDIFYLPRRKFEIFYYMANVFKRNKIFLEIAVPTILNGIDSEGDALIMKSVYSWGYQFHISRYHSAENFAHPFKMSGLWKSPLGYQFCKLHVQEKIYRNI